MADIRQSSQYARFMVDLGWKTEKVGKWNAYIKKIPLIGYFIKIQKIRSPIPFEEIEKLRKKYKLLKLQISPDILSTNRNVYKQFIDHNFKIDFSPNIPTQTIQINLSQSEKKLFNNLTSAKRRAVRRAIKNGVMVRQSNDIGSFITIRKRQNFPMGFLLVTEMEKLWKNFYPDKASLLLAYKDKQTISGILLLFNDQVAYYWYASSMHQGKQLFAPTILAWEAIKLAKKKGYKIFDFEGIYDERFSQSTQSWRGFTKFKEGFGGKKISYIGSFVK